MNDPLVVAHSCRTWLAQTETWMYEQISHLPSSVESHIVCGSTENLEQFRLPNIHSLRDDAPARYYWERTLRKLGVRRRSEFLVDTARGAGARLLHSHFGNVGWVNMEAARRTGMRHVVTFYGRDASHLPHSDPRYRERYRELFASVDRVLCMGPHMAQTLRALGCPDAVLRIHPLGIRLSDIRFQPRSWQKGTPLRVLLAASFSEKKGFPYALKALGKLRRELPVEITIIGDTRGGEMTPEKKRILDTLNDEGLRPVTRLLGFQTHQALFREAYQHHVFLSPSVSAADGDTEGWLPVTVVEMAATGMPAVSTDHCDMPQALSDGVSGLLAAERDVDGLVQRLLWLAEHPERWVDMVTKARRHFEDLYDAKTQGLRLADIYQEALGLPAAREAARL